MRQNHFPRGVMTGVPLCKLHLIHIAKVFFGGGTCDNYFVLIISGVQKEQSKIRTTINAKVLELS